MIKKIRLALIHIILSVICILSLLISVDTLSNVSASSIILDTNNSYTNVLKDLQTDEDFDISNYPIDKNDYNLYVIQIAESASDELFIYVYQPSGNSYGYNATSINISTGLFENAHWINYSLTQLSYYGVFYKYKVDNFKVLSDAVRYYDISAIYRQFVSDIDGKVSDDNAINELSIKVAKCFTACTIDSNVTYSVCETEVVEIVHQWNGTFRYYEGGFWFGSSFKDLEDRHIVAFSTDLAIDKLYEIEIEFDVRGYTALGFHTLWDLIEWYPVKTYGDPVHVRQTYTCHDEYETGKYTIGLGGVTTYSWQLIQSSSEFIEENKDKGVMSEKSKSQIEQCDWVLTYYASDYSSGNALGVEQCSGQETYGSVITRLKFETDGVIYNLGVVGDKQTGSVDKPQKDKAEAVIKLILVVLLIILFVIVLGPILPMIISFIIKTVKFVFKIIWWVISLPFKIFKKK